jgi:hypothetical protein
MHAHTQYTCIQVSFTACIWLSLRACVDVHLNIHIYAYTKLHMTITCRLQYAILHAQPRYAQTVPSLLRAASSHSLIVRLTIRHYVYESLDTHKLCGNLADRGSSIAHVRMLLVTFLRTYEQNSGELIVKETMGTYTRRLPFNQETRLNPSTCYFSTAVRDLLSRIETFLPHLNPRDKKVQSTL